MSIFDVLNPVKAVLDVANGILGKFVADPKERADAQLALYQAQAAAQDALLQADQQMADAQQKVIVAEAQSQSWIARNWRPLIMLTFGFIIAWNYIVVPLTGAPHADVPTDLWTLMKLGMSGYIVGRSAEKIVPQIINGTK